MAQVQLPQQVIVQAVFGGGLVGFGGAIEG